MPKQNRTKTNQELGNPNILIDDAILFHNPAIQAIPFICHTINLLILSSQNVQENNAFKFFD